MECTITGIVFHHVFIARCHCYKHTAAASLTLELVSHDSNTRWCGKAKRQELWSQQWYQHVIKPQQQWNGNDSKDCYMSPTQCLHWKEKWNTYSFPSRENKQTNRKSIPSWQIACKYKNADFYSSDHPTFASLPNLSFSSLIFWVHVFLNCINVVNCVCYTANFLGNGKHALLKPWQWWKDLYIK